MLRSRYQLCLWLVLAVVPHEALGQALATPQGGRPGAPLPYVVRGDSLIPDPYPDWGFSIGVAGSSADLKGIRPALTAIRDEAAVAGYTIEERAPKTTIGKLLYADLRVRFSGAWGAAIKVATGRGLDVQRFTLTSFDVLWTPASLHYPRRVVSPLFTLGPTFYTFRSKIRYGTNSRVSPNDGGSFDYLDNVVLDGGAWGIKGGGGVTIAASRSAELSATLEYALFPSVQSRSFGDTRAKMNANSMFGSIRLSLYP